MKEIDTEKIRSLLEKAWNSSSGDFIGDGTDFDKWRPKYVGFLRSQIHQALSLLPPPCEMCGGSEKLEVCDNCGKVLQKTTVYPKLAKCFECGKGKPKAIPCTACQALSLLPKPDSAEPSCDNCRMRETCGAKGEVCNDYSKDETLPTYQTTSVLPKQPCERCGGSGFVPNPAYIKHCKDKENIPRHMRTRDNPYPTTIPCHACKFGREYNLSVNSRGEVLHPSPPAGKVEEFVKRVRDEAETLQLYDESKSRRGAFLYGDIYQACTHLTAQAKQIKELEDGAFAANEEAQIRNDQIKQLEAKISLALLELAQIEAEKTPTEIRIENILKGGE